MASPLLRRDVRLREVVQLLSAHTARKQQYGTLRGQPLPHRSPGSFLQRVSSFYVTVTSAWDRFGLGLFAWPHMLGQNMMGTEVSGRGQLYTSW